jgi:hypothetical protein
MWRSAAAARASKAFGEPGQPAQMQAGGHAAGEVGLLVERAQGRPQRVVGRLGLGAEVHHLDEQRRDARQRRHVVDRDIGDGAVEHAAIVGLVGILHDRDPPQLLDRREAGGAVRPGCRSRAPPRRPGRASAPRNGKARRSTAAGRSRAGRERGAGNRRQPADGYRAALRRCAPAAAAPHRPGAPPAGSPRGRGSAAGRSDRARDAAPRTPPPADPAAVRPPAR